MSYLIKQRDSSDCGPACLASVAAYFHLLIPVAKIRQYAGTDKNGTNMKGLLQAAVKLGFDAKGVKGILSSLNQIPLPAVAHIVKGSLHHYVVIYKVRPRHVYVMDPEQGRICRYHKNAFAKEWTGVLLLLQPAEDFKPGKEHQSNLNRFWQLLRPHRHMMLQILFGASIYTILGLSTAIFVEKITDYVLPDSNRNLLNLLAVMMIIILFLQLFLGTIKNIFTLRTGQQIDARLILGYYRHLLKLPQQFFDTMRTGEILSRFNDALKISALVNDVAIGLVVNLFIVFFSFALMFTYYWKLALLIFIIAPLYLSVYLITNLLNKKVQRRLMEESASLESELVESLNAVGTIKHFGLEAFTYARAENHVVRLLATAYKSRKNMLFSGVSVDLISQLFTIVMLWAGAVYVLDRELTPGELFSFYTLIAYFTGPAAALIGANKVIQDALIAADRLFEIIDLSPEADSQGIELSSAITGDIRFENVTFGYGSRGAVFNQLNLSIKAGSFTAIVGESGAGKSTLAALLHKLYPLQEGNIFLGKYTITHLTNESLRNRIGIVPQKIDLFTGSVIDNIAVGDYKPDLQRIIDLCRELGMLSFIEALPAGFETYLGENGTLLSGGQKQRIAIARALYRNPEILVLDEAVSALDPVAEKYVQSTIEMLVNLQKTIIVIAHRLTTTCNADKIIVLAAGKVAEEGRHEELMSAQGQYFSLWQEQFGAVKL